MGLTREESIEKARLRRLEQYRDEMRRGSWFAVISGLAMLAFCLLVALLLEEQRWLVVQSPLFIVGVLGVVAGSWELRRIHTITLDDLERRWANATRIQKAVFTRRPWYSITIASCLVAVSIVQLVVDPEGSVEAAGLVKDAVRAGQVWRLLTAETLHGGFMHLWFNVGALLALGRAVENLVTRGFMATTFLLSAIGASLCSLLLMPDTTSVGASGGIMGLVGALFVVGHYRRRLLPGLMKNMLVSIALVALSGLFGFAIIDNAAHLGGLVTGAALAFAALDKRDEGGSVLHETELMRSIGILSLLIVVGGCGLSTFLIIAAR